MSTQITRSLRAYRVPATPVNRRYARSMPGTAEPPIERRWPDSRITAFYRTQPKPRPLRPPRDEWVVVVTTGALADHHRFDDELDAMCFALQIDPEFIPPAETDPPTDRS